MAGRDAAPSRGISHGLIDNFFLTDAELDNSPSRKDGVDAETERSQRVFGCESIQTAVLYMKAPQAVAATGQALLHRFYCKQSMQDFDVKEVAWAATFLACKLEEFVAGRPHAVLRVFHRMDARREGRPIESLQSWSQEYAVMKQRMFTVESHMLRAFGFVGHVEHPHKFVLSLLIMMEQGPQLQQEAWSLANDSLRTTLCVRFKSETVACGIVFMAARRCQVALPEHHELTPGRRQSWWEVCGVPQQDVYTVATELHQLYSLPKAEYVRLKRASAQIPVPAGSTKTAPAAEASPAVSAQLSVQLPAEGGEGAPAGDGGGDSSKRGGAAEGVPVGLRDAASRDHTGERRLGSDGDTGGRSERSALAEPGGKRDREPSVVDKEREAKRRREDRTERSRTVSRSRDGGGRDRERERPRGEYPARDGKRDERSRHRERDSRSRDMRPSDRGADRPPSRSQHYPDEDRGQRRSRPASPVRAPGAPASERDRERAPRPVSGADGRLPLPDRPPSRTGNSDRGSDRAADGPSRNRSPLDPGSASKRPRDAPTELRGPPLKQARVVRPPGISPTPSRSVTPPAVGAPLAGAAGVRARSSASEGRSHGSPDKRTNGHVREAATARGAGTSRSRSRSRGRSVSPTGR